MIRLSTAGARVIDGEIAFDLELCYKGDQEQGMQHTFFLWQMTQALDIGDVGGRMGMAAGTNKLKRPRLSG